MLIIIHQFDHSINIRMIMIFKVNMENVYAIILNYKTE